MAASTAISVPPSRVAASRVVPASAALIVAVLLTLSLRLPSLFEPHYYGDEGVFAATAQRLLAGGTLYADTWDDKPPLVFLLYAVVLKLFGPSMLALRLVGVAWAAATALTVLAIGRRTGGEATAWVATLLFAVLASLPMIEGNLLLTEPLMALPAALAMLLGSDAVARAGGARTGRLLGAGALLGIAFLFKQVAALDAIALALWLLCRHGRPLRDTALLTAGWSIPVAMALLWLAGDGALGPAWHGVVGFYGVYLGEGSAAPIGLRILRFAPVAVALGWLLWQRRRGQVSSSDLIPLWFGCAVLGATLAGRPYGHYLVQPLAPCALLAAGLLGRTDGNARQVRGAILGVALAVVVAGFRGFWWSHPTLTPAYYTNWAAWMSGRTSRAEFERFYSWRVANQQALTQAMERDRDWAEGRDRMLYVWGEYPWLYPLADAANPTRYSTSYQTSFLPGAKRDVISALQQHPPRFIAQEREEWRRLPGLDALLQSFYTPIAEIDNTRLWRRNE